jgi:hypothetical protein
MLCEVSGELPEADRVQLVAAFERAFDRTFTDDPFALQQSWDASAVLVATAIAALAAFLWLAMTGAFTFGSWRRSDWIALLPFAGALVVREYLTLHSIQEIEIQFALTPVGRHSVVYPLFQLLYSRLVRDPQTATFHINGVVGALAVLPLYLFVRQRTADLAAALAVACIFAVHPLVARFAPTDAPYSFILFTWFSGLALLSAPAADALSTVGGCGLLGLAASARMDGVLVLAASVLILDRGLLLRRLKKTPTAAVAGTCAIGLLIGVQMYFLFAFHAQGMLHPDNSPWKRLHEVWQEIVLEPRAVNELWANLIVVGALAGLVRRWRLGLEAFAALVGMIATSQQSIDPNAWHRLVPTASLQCIVAGIAVTALCVVAPGSKKKTWAASLPGIVTALCVLLTYRSVLSASYVFNDEYAMLRRTLARDGTVDTSCDLIVRTRVEKDAEIRDFRRVVPGIHVIDCSVDDCVHSLNSDRCQYYFRSAACFFHPEGLSEPCAKASSDDVTRGECLMPECAALESAAELTPIALASLHPWISFPREAWNYPSQIPIGLFRVASSSMQIRPVVGSAGSQEEKPDTPQAREPTKIQFQGHPPDLHTDNACSLILPETAAGPIEEAFARMGPSLHYESISIEEDHVVARLCPASGEPSRCFGLRLDPPHAGCESLYGPFCATFPDGPQPAAASTIEVGLRSLRGIPLWSVADPNCGEVPTSTTPPLPRSRDQSNGN